MHCSLCCFNVFITLVSFPVNIRILIRSIKGNINREAIDLKGSHAIFCGNGANLFHRHKITVAIHRLIGIHGRAQQLQQRILDLCHGHKGQIRAAFNGTGIVDNVEQSCNIIRHRDSNGNGLSLIDGLPLIAIFVIDLNIIDCNLFIYTQFRDADIHRCAHRQITGNHNTGSLVNTAIVRHREDQHIRTDHRPFLILIIAGLVLENPRVLLQFRRQGAPLCRIDFQPQSSGFLHPMDIYHHQLQRPLRNIRCNEALRLILPIHIGIIRNEHLSVNRKIHLCFRADQSAIGTGVIHLLRNRGRGCDHKRIRIAQTGNIILAVSVHFEFRHGQHRHLPVPA